MCSGSGLIFIRLKIMQFLPEDISICICSQTLYIFIFAAKLILILFWKTLSVRLVDVKNIV